MSIQEPVETRALEHSPRRAEAAARKLSAALIVLGIGFAPLLASAAESGKGKPKPVSKPSPIEAQERSEQTLAHKMMGHINLASVALSTGLPDAASEHIQKAGKLAAQLEREAPAVSTSRHFKYGKISYSEKAQTMNYYVPVFDDVFLVSDYKETLHAFRNADLEVTDAGVVEVTLSADLRDVKKALAEAQAKIAAKQYVEAKRALGGVFKDAIREERIVDEPIWTVHDNLALAQNLIREQHYDAARFALQRARKGLEKLEQRNSDEKVKAEFKQMNDEVAKLDADLLSQDPTISERAEAIFSSWRRSMSSWFSFRT